MGVDVFRLKGKTSFPPPVKKGKHVPDVPDDSLKDLKSVFSLLVTGEKSDRAHEDDLLRTPVNINGVPFNGGDLGILGSEKRDDPKGKELFSEWRKGAKPEGLKRISGLHQGTMVHALSFIRDNYQLKNGEKVFPIILNPQASFEKNGDNYSLTYTGSVYTFIDEKGKAFGLDQQGKKFIIEDKGKIPDMIKNGQLKLICKIDAKSKVDCSQEPPESSFELTIDYSVPQFQYRGPPKMEGIPPGVTFTKDLGVNRTINLIAQDLISSIDVYLNTNPEESKLRRALQENRKQLEGIIKSEDQHEKIIKMKTVIPAIIKVTENVEELNPLQKFAKWLDKQLEQKPKNAEKPKNAAEEIYKRALKYQPHFNQIKKKTPSLKESATTPTAASPVPKPPSPLTKRVRVQ